MRYVVTTTLLLVAAVPAIPLWAQAPAQKRTGPPTAVLRSGPEVGRRAPDFTLPWASKDGVGPAESPYQLWGDLGKTVVLMFYSRAFTKSATAQLRTLPEQYGDLFGPDVVVLGISTDPPDTQSRFAEQLGIPFRLLSDPELQVAKKYGNRESSGVIRRSVYVVGPDGKVRYRDMQFDPFDARAYSAIRKAVASVRPAAPPR